MRVYLSTVVRGAPAGQAGELIALDWKSKKVLGRAPLAPTNPPLDDPNPRGGGRGGRGIVLLREELFVATYHSLHGFDHALRPTRIITNHNFAGLHELKLVDDGIWASSTALGAVLKVGFDGRVLQSWWAHEDPVIREKFSALPFTVEKDKDNRLAYLNGFSKLHLNNVEVHKGQVYVCFNNHGAIIRLFPTTVIAHDPELKGCHNGLVTDDEEVLLNDSHHHVVVVFDLHTGHVKRRINLADFPEVARLKHLRGCRDIGWRARLQNFVMRQRVARPLFTRGMCLLDASRILVGVSPATVLEIDYKQGRLLDLCQLSNSANECIHGLEAAPSVDFPFPIS
ncbi:MAG: hypothetical protein HY298_24985 [Verrucomicrobia bacterium]|nr:hypothetical protein [Verrucomicrobiota bacterium]